MISAACQDAVVPLNDIAYLPGDRRFLMVPSRFRWEAPPEAGENGRPVFSRIHAVLTVESVAGVRLRGIDLKHRHRVLELLSLRPIDGGLVIDFAGGAAIRLTLDRLRLALCDYGEPWPTGQLPRHPAEAPP